LDESRWLRHFDLEGLFTAKTRPGAWKFRTCFGG